MKTDLIVAKMTWGQIFKLSLFDLVHNAIDMCFVYAAFYLAWGMAVQSWWWLIVLGVLGRWVHKIIWSAGAQKRYEAMHGKEPHA